MALSRHRLRGLSIPALAIALSAGLLLARVDERALEARGLGRLLEADLDGLDGETPAESEGLFAWIAAHATPPGVSTLQLVVTDPAASDGPSQTLRLAAFVRAFDAQLGRFNAMHRPTDAPLVRESGLADLVLELRPRVRNDALFADARVSLRGSQGAEGEARFTLDAGGRGFRLPGRGALLPPLVAIVVALCLRRTITALFLGVWAGAAALAVFDGSSLIGGLLWGLWNVPTVYLRHEIVDTFRLEILGFIAALVGMVGVMSRGGGIAGSIDRIVRFARTRRSAQGVTFSMGLLLFFDDYANCMLVGSTMRPLTDRMRISREKLAYLVDSTAAPVAGLSLLSTWIAFEVSVFSPQLPAAGIVEDGYSVFLQTLPYRFYCLFTLAFVLGLVLSGRDFGPMARAESRASREGLLVAAGRTAPISDTLTDMEPKPGLRRDWRRAAAPVVVTVLGTVASIFVAGGGLALLRDAPARLLSLEGLTGVLLAGGGPRPIFLGALAGLWLATFLVASRLARVSMGVGSLLACGVSLALSDAGDGGAEPLVLYLAAGTSMALGCGLTTLLAQRLIPRLDVPGEPHLSAREIAAATSASAQTLGFAVALLFLAWMIGRVCQELSTADYLVALLSGAIPPGGLPVLLFGLSCAVSFATGSSWSTMSILLPNIVGLAASIGADSPLGSATMVVVCIGAVLEGSIFGDHCSPISDTTVLSSVASGSDHLDHVRTQAPYALFAAGIAITCGYLPTLLVPGWGFGWAMASGAAVIAVVLRGLGRPAEPVRAD